MHRLLDAIVHRLGSVLADLRPSAGPAAAPFDPQAALARTLAAGLPAASAAAVVAETAAEVPRGAAAGSGPLGFVRTQPALGTHDPAATPAWAHGMAVIATAGPFSAAHGVTTWVDGIAPATLIEVTRDVGGPPIAFVIASPPSYSFSGGMVSVSFSAGSAWLVATLLDPLAPADGFAGVAFTSATIEFPAASEPPAGPAVPVPAGETALFTIAPVPAATPAGGTLDDDGAAAPAQLPASITFALAPAATSLAALGDAQLTAYGSTVALSGGPAASSFDAGQLEWAASYATVPGQTVSFDRPRSTAFVTSGSAPVTGGSYRLPVARTAPGNLAAAADGGSLGLALGTGVFGQWGHLRAPLPLAGVALTVRQGQLQVRATTAARPFADSYALWDAAGGQGPARSAVIVLTAARGATVASYQSAAIDMVRVTGCAIEGHLDQPCLADGTTPRLGELTAAYLVGRTATGEVLAVDAAGPPPDPIVKAPAETYVIRNALLMTAGLDALLLRARLSGARAQAGLLVFAAALEQLTPMLPDPYAATVITQTRPTRTLVGAVRWASPAAPVLSFDIAAPAGAGVADPVAPGAAVGGAAVGGAGVAGARDQLEHADILFDVSSSGDQLGVALSPAALDTAQVSGQTLLISGEQSQLYALPQIAWEAVITDDPPGPRAIYSVAGAFAGDDGPPTTVNVPTQALRPMTPLAFIGQFLADFATGADLDAHVTLPFGLEAIISTAANDRQELAMRPALTLEAPAFGAAKGGLQLAIRSTTDPKHPFALLPGSSFTTTDQADPGYPPAVLNSLGDAVADNWNSQFSIGIQPFAPFVPLERFDVCGYGASLFSDVDLSAIVAAGITEVRFDVIVGRTEYALIQLHSYILPWRVQVVNTTIFERDGAAWIQRHNTGWRAKGAGLFDYEQTPQVERGGVIGLVNVRNIQALDAAPVPAGANSYAPVTFDADVQVLTDPGAHGLTIHGGDIGGGMLAGSGFCGWVDLTPAGTPPGLADAVALMDTVGSASGKVAADVEIAQTKIALTLTGVDVAATPGPGPRTLGVALRGLPHLPRDGSWTIAKRSASQPTPSPVDPLTPVPLVRNDAAPQTWYLAEPADVLTLTAPATPYGILQSTGTQKIFFEQPTITDTAGQNPLGFVQPPKLAHVGALLGNSDLLPGLSALLDFAGFPGFSAVGDGLAIGDGTAAQPLTQTTQLADQSLIAFGPISVVLATNQDPSLLPGSPNPPPAPPLQSVITVTIDPTATPRWSVTITNVAFKLVVDGMGDSNDPLVAVAGDIVAADGQAPTLKNVAFGYGSALSIVKQVLSGIEVLAEALPGGGDTGLDVSFTGTKLSIRDAVSLPQLPLGFGYIEGISLDLGFDLDVLAKTMSFNVGVGTDQDPFSWLASPLAGNGLLQLGAAQTLGVRMQGGIGVGLGIDVAIASGSASVCLAVQLDTTKTPFGVMVLLTGNASVDVLDGLASASLSLTAGLGVQVTPGPPSDLIPPPPNLEAFIDATSITLSAQVAVAIHLTVGWLVHVDWSGSWGFSETVSGKALTSVLP